MTERNPTSPQEDGKDNSITAISPLSSVNYSVSPDKPYSIFTAIEKWLIVAIGSAAGFLSPLSANIYFPAIPTLAIAFHKSTELINLTVTINMVVQGISPMVWGPIADRSGRRLVLLACILILSVSCIGLAMVPTNAYWALLLLRCLQAAGSASSIALGAGIVADVSISAERGGFMSLFSMGQMMGPCLGPVVGGALAGHLGWRSLFWFLLIVSAVCFILVLLFLPETLRAVVGDGSIPPPKFYVPLIPVFGRSRKKTLDVERPPRNRLQNPFTLFLCPDIVILMTLTTFAYCILYSISATMSALFRNAYPYLNETDIGLCFLAIGGGMMFANVFNGRLLDRQYQKVKEDMIRNLEAVQIEKGVALKPADVVKDEYFPIEYARLKFLPGYVVLFITATIAYGWCIDKGVVLAVPLFLQVLIGYGIWVVMGTCQTLVVDCTPSRGSSVTACSNLVRCSFGAATVSVIDLIIKAFGIGWTYTLLGCLCIVCFPLIWIEIRMGPTWRARRRDRNKDITQ